MKLKIFHGNLDGRREVLAACRSKNAFKNLTGCTLTYMTETGNAKHIEVAMSKPGQAFIKKFRGEEEWKPYERL